MGRKPWPIVPLTDDEREAAGEVYHDALACVKALAKRRRWPMIDDIEGLVAVGVIRAAKSFVAGRGRTFKTWAVYKAAWSVRESLRGDSGEVVSADTVPLREYEVAAPERPGPDDGSLEQIISLAPARTRELLRLVYRDGLGWGAAAAKLGKNRQWADCRKHEALKTLRKSPKLRQSA